VNADITNSTINLTTKVTGTLPIANGGTNSSTSLSGSSIMISNGSAIIQGAAGTTNTVLHGNAGAAPTFGAVNLVNEITGTLPVGNGGTGATTLADHGVLIGSGTGMISATAVGIDGQVLQSAGPGFDPTYSTATYPSTAGTAGNILRSNGTNFISTPINQAQATPNNPVGTSNLTGVMMGLNQAFTPARSGMILIIISGDIGNSLANDGGQVQIRYGTGSIPTNGAALTGSTAGGLVKLLSVGATAGRRYPFTANAIVTSLTPGNLIWIDVGLAAITGGTALIYDLSISVIEL
jgi:hypothetical protein